MEFKNAVQKLQEKGIDFEVNPNTDCLSFWKEVNGEKTKLWCLDKYDNAICDFVVDNNDHIEEIVCMFWDQPMLVDLDCVDDRHYECESCDEWGDDEEKEKEMWDKHYKDQYESDYNDRYRDLMAATGGL